MATTRNDDEEAPLDPAVERVRAKLARLVLFSFGTMALGLVALLLAILYKLGTFGDTADKPVDAVAELPAGAQVISSSVSDDTLVVTVTLPGGAQEVRMFRIPGGEPVGRVQFTAPAQ
ncbi:MAG: hypothetical protein KDJ55_05265 [Rhodobiaceae bacterium]|nr:hypothetical protein [Rhodobiaceae bacterium]MCC0051440.1 hypothetical protein [Rhodobiaceae bacterium]MCC0062396.1 hypothetical protein [Rhodobiaceae bacterium]